MPDQDSGAAPQPDRNAGARPARGHSLGKAAIGIPLLALGWLGHKASTIPHDLALQPSVSGERLQLSSSVGPLAYYVSGPAPAEGAPPLLLVHSVNAAASAYEVKPLYERMRATHVVYALELPGFGFSDRSQRLYTPRIMTDAIIAMVEEIQRRHGTAAIDALAVSLSCEFLARAASEHPAQFRSLALVSPTGLDRRGPYEDAPGTTRGMPPLYKAFTVPLWRRPIFDLLTSRVSIRYFLEKTWGSKDIDEGLLDYDYATTHQPGAEHAPYSFIGGFLFSKDITRVYDALTGPVWMVHGTRGDFTDYGQKRRYAGKSNWSIDVMEAGAMPYFEQPDAFVARFESFLGTAPARAIQAR